MYIKCACVGGEWCRWVKIAECVREPRRGEEGVVSNSCQDLLTFFRGLDTSFFSVRDCFDIECACEATGEGHNISGVD